jgi:hypothetical protein
VDGHGSAVRISGRRGEVGWTGPSGEDLRDQLLTHAAHWTSLGAPASGDYHSRFVPLSEPAPAPALAERTWVVDRVRFRQIVTL